MDTGTNAVIALEIPLDLPNDASDGDKLKATIEILDSLQVPDSANTAVSWRDVGKSS
jgi:hypothetical protein